MAYTADVPVSYTHLDVYKRQVQSVAVKAMLVTTEGMDEQMAYDVTKAIYTLSLIHI